MLRILAIITALFALAACSGSPAPSAALPTTPAPPTSSAVVPQTTSSSVPLADLPHAPPLATWVVKGSDFQRTLDLNVQTALIEAGVSIDQADEQAARDFAYHVCSGLRAHRATAPNLVHEAYPDAELPETVGLGLAAQAYCLDTVPTS